MSKDERRKDGMRDIRSRDGRKLCRFDPDRDILEFKDRGQVETVDLQRYRRGEAPEKR
jgi:hypothetical protein